MILQSTTVKVIRERSGLIYIFSASGVDIYRHADWQRLAWAILPGVRSGAVNDLGVWLATEFGLWHLPHGVTGAASGQLAQTYTATSATALGSSDVLGVDGAGSALLLVTAAGVDYLPAPGAVYHYPVVSLPGACAVWGTKIAYAIASGLHVLTAPAADWTAAAATVLTTASSPAIVSNTVQALAAGTDLFIATAAGVSIYDNTDVVNLTSTALGTVVDAKAVYPSPTATQAAGLLAYGTSDGAAGGRFGLYSLAGASNKTTVAGDTLAVWTDGEAQAAIYDDTLAQYAAVTALSPADSAREVRRDWSLYAEITDSLGGIATASVALTVNGAAVTPTTTAITNGYRVEFTPAAASGYREQVRVVLSATDADGYAVGRAWTFTTAAAPAATVTDAPPPNVVCIRDIGLTAAEADETVEAVPVVWLDDLTSPLYITEAQAREVGRVAIDERTFHRHIRSVAVLARDAAELPLAGLQQGSIITLTCPAIGMNAKKCEVLACQRQTERDGEEDMVYTLQVAYYEAV